MNTVMHIEGFIIPFTFGTQRQRIKMFLLKDLLGSGSARHEAVITFPFVLLLVLLTHTVTLPSTDLLN